VTGCAANLTEGNYSVVICELLACA
jgi:hypothetical protein